MNLFNLKLESAIVKVVSLGFLFGIIESFNLWHSDRLFPLIPVFKNFFEIPITLNYLLLGILILCLIAMLLSKNRVLIIGFISVNIFLIFQDQNRLQPWVYIYILFLIPIILNRSKNSNFTRNCIQIILIGIYLWSGIHKLNPNFIDVTYRSILIYLFRFNYAALSDFILFSGYLIPLLEISVGYLLFNPKTRKTGVKLSILIHSFIILYILSIGGQNSVVIPWNFVMAFIVFLVFYNQKNQLLKFKKEINFNKFIYYLIALIIYVLPILNFFERWDTYTSFSFYSSKNKNYYVFIKPQSDSKSINEYAPYFKNLKELNNTKILDLNLWAYKELNVPFYPEKRIFEYVKSELCFKINKSNRLLFTEFDKPLWDIFIYDSSKKVTSSIDFVKFEAPIHLPKFSYTSCQNNQFK